MRVVCVATEGPIDTSVARRICDEVDLEIAAVHGERGKGRLDRSLGGSPLDAADHDALDEVALDERVDAQDGGNGDHDHRRFQTLRRRELVDRIISVSSIIPAVRMLRSTTCSGSLTVSLMYRKA